MRLYIDSTMNKNSIVRIDGTHDLPQDIDYTIGLVIDGKRIEFTAQVIEFSDEPRASIEIKPVLNKGFKELPKERR